MLAIIDFDHTLFNATSFKRALANSLADLNISPKDFLNSYSDIVKRDNKRYDYDYQLQAERLAQKFNLAKKEITKRLKEVLEKSAEFLYPDTQEFLTNLKSKKVKLIILTLGNASWQQTKFKFSKLEKFFKEKYFVEKISEKNKILKRFIQSNTNVFYLNDNPAEIIEARKQFPQINILYIQRPEGKYKQTLKNVKQFSNLKQVLDEFSHIYH